jgi:hypothetical protein
MYECYDCQETFHHYGDCPNCGSVNVGAISENDEELQYFDDYTDYENDEEINEALRDVEYEDDYDEDNDEDY